MPEPAMSKILNEDMRISLLAGDGGHQRPELRREKLQRRLVAHRVVGKCRLLELRVDGIAVQRWRERCAVFQESRGGTRLECLAGTTDVAGLRGLQRAGRSGTLRT